MAIRIMLMIRVQKRSFSNEFFETSKSLNLQTVAHAPDCFYSQAALYGFQSSSQKMDIVVQVSLLYFRVNSPDLELKSAFLEECGLDFQ